MEKTSEIAKELIEMLVDLSDDDEFVLGIMTDLETDDERKIVIDYINNGEDVTYENLILLSLHLNNKREKNMKKETTTNENFSPHAFR